MNIKRKIAGFTLIELMVALAILASLAMVALPMTEVSVKRAQEEQLRLALREIRGALDAYKKASDDGLIETPLDASGYPPDLETLERGVKDKLSINDKKIFFLRKIPRDPTCDCAQMTAAQTWDLRSYDSEFDAPQPGEDVFDVTSMNTKEGLNGIPYMQW